METLVQYSVMERRGRIDEMEGVMFLKCGSEVYIAGWRRLRKDAMLPCRRVSLGSCFGSKWVYAKPRIYHLPLSLRSRLATGQTCQIRVLFERPYQSNIRAHS
jgi:hypothetical protein